MFDSSWEVKVYQYCKENNIPFDRTSDKLYEAKHQCMINNNIIILKEDDIKQLNNILKKE